MAGDAADQIVRYSLEGTEVAPADGEAAKILRCSAAAVLQDQKNAWQNQSDALAGEQAARFEIPENRMKEFRTEANVRGLLYVPVRDRSKAAGKIEFASVSGGRGQGQPRAGEMGVDYLGMADTGAKAEGGSNACGGAAGCGTDGGREMPEGRIALEVTELDDAFNVGGNFTQRTGPDIPAAEKSPSALSHSEARSHSPGAKRDPGWKAAGNSQKQQGWANWKGSRRGKAANAGRTPRPPENTGKNRKGRCDGEWIHKTG